MIRKGPVFEWIGGIFINMIKKGPSPVRIQEKGISGNSQYSQNGLQQERPAVRRPGS